MIYESLSISMIPNDLSSIKDFIMSIVYERLHLWKYNLQFCMTENRQIMTDQIDVLLKRLVDGFV